jgi:predicted Zn-dependent peptidase
MAGKNKEAYDIYKLKNGLTIIFIPLVKNVVSDKKCLKSNKYINNVSINLLLPVGSRHETEKNSGISHILEHASFRQMFNDEVSIMRKLQMNGCLFNAETSLEYTHYYVISDKKFIDDNLRIMANILFNLNFNKDEINKEKNVVLEEYFMGKDSVKNVLMENLLGLLTNKKHPIKKPVIGTLENIKRTSVKDLVEYKKRYYNTNTAILVLSGDYDKNEIIQKCNLYFREKRQGKLEFPIPLKVEKNGIKINTLFKQGFNHTYFCIGFNCVNVYNKEIYIYDVLAQILKTKLFLALRETNGLTYSSNVLSSYHSDFGLFGILSSVISDYIYKTIYIVLGILYNLKKELVGKDELESAIETIKNNVNVELTSVLNHNRIYGFQKLFRISEIETPGKYLDNLSKVSQDDILNIAKKMFIKDNMLFVSVGELENNNNLKKLLSLLK